jgi:two-component system cell cycle response regulator DivK
MGLAMGRPPRTVLVVEDNERSMALFREILEVNGNKVVQARDGAEGLRLARQYRPDLIVMDIQLPDTSGLEIARWLKDDHELRDIPIVAVTAFSRMADQEMARASGCDAYVTKPISMTDFLASVQGLLGRARPRASQLPRDAVSVASEMDIWNLALAMIEQYGTDAALEAGNRSDKLTAEGDISGSEVWQRTMAAILRLQADRPHDDEALN